MILPDDDVAVPQRVKLTIPEKWLRIITYF